MDSVMVGTNTIDDSVLITIKPLTEAAPINIWTIIGVLGAATVGLYLIFRKG